MKILLLMIAIITIAGCATTPTVAPTSLFKARPVTNAATADAAFFGTLADCQSVMYGLEQKATNLQAWGVALQTIGGIAGSILLPVAAVANTARTTMVALGTIAGFTNTEISVVNNAGLGAADVIRTRALMQANMEVGVKNYYAAQSAKPVDLAGVQVAIDQMKVACVSYWLASPTAAPIAVSP